MWPQWLTYRKSYLFETPLTVVHKCTRHGYKDKQAFIQAKLIIARCADGPITVDRNVCSTYVWLGLLLCHRTVWTCCACVFVCNQSVALYWPQQKQGFPLFPFPIDCNEPLLTQSAWLAKPNAVCLRLSVHRSIQSCAVSWSVSRCVAGLQVFVLIHNARHFTLT